MKCVTPLIRFYDRGYPDRYFIKSKKYVERQLETNPNYFRDIIEKHNKNWLQLGVQQIPCGKCYGCRLSYAADWATLLMLEREYYPEDEAWFITITYDDEHRPKVDKMDYVKKDKKYYLNDEKITYTNDGTWNGTLVLSDLQNFIKRIRKKYPNKDIRYFACGEYGSKTMLPHYHLILFGVNFYDRKIKNIDNNYKEHFTSETLNKLWNEPNYHGIINELSPVEWTNCSYVARYCMKKVGETWNKKEWAKLGKIPEFVTMSRDIGLRYYYEHRDEIWATDNIIIKGMKGEIKAVKPPKKYLRILEREDPKKAALIKAKRAELAEKLTETSNQESDYTDIEKLIIKAEELQTRSNMLKRLL